MRSISTCSVLLATTLCAMGSPAAAAVHDDAQLFSRDAIAQANRRIAELEAAHHHRIRIETYDSVHGDVERVTSMTRSERDQFFSNWLRERAKATKAEGLFLLITRQPSHLQVGVSNSLRKAGFTQAQRQELISRMTSAFRDGDFDRGLNDGLTSIERSFGSLAATPVTVPRPAQAPAPVQRRNGWSLGSLLLIVALVVGGLFLISMLSRAFSGPRQAPQGGNWYGGGHGGGYGPGGGGSWLGSLMAGLGGAFAGNWLYDTFASGHRGQAHADETWTGGGATHSPAHETWDSSGGEWGDGGGGDFSGGDFGDSGGGDW